MKLTKLAVTAALLIGAVSLTLQNADSNFEKTGAYRTELVVWEQNSPGKGDLLIFGHPLRIDLGRLESLGERLGELAGKFVQELPDAAESDTEPSETKLSDHP